jgi:hypothetical protein
MTEGGTMSLTYEQTGVLHGVLEGFMLELRLDAGEELEIEPGPTNGHPKVQLIEDLASDLLLCARVWRALEKGEFPLDQAAVDLLVTFEHDAAEMASWAEESPVPGDCTMARARLLVIRMLREEADRRLDEREVSTLAVDARRLPLSHTQPATDTPAT